MLSVSLRKLSSTNAFIVTDLDGAPSSGIIRSAPKILQGGAADLARSLTYTFASVEMARGGASAGINAQPDERADAVLAFVEEIGPEVTSGDLTLDAGKGVPASSLEPLTATDGRNPVRSTQHEGDELHVHLAGLGPAVAAERALGGLDGKSVAVEGFAEHGPALAAAVAARGGRVISVSTTAGSITDAEGLAPADLRQLWNDHGADLVGQQGDPAPAWKVFQSGADVLFAGSKMGAVNHTTAEKLQLSALVPHQPIPFTARAMAILQRAGCIVLPDFLTVAAPIFASWPTGEATPDAVVSAATDAITSALDETLGHEHGAFLGACHRAEAFLSTWRDELPFGRPLAS